VASNDLMKFGLIAGGAYLVYQWWGKPAASPVVPVSSGGAPAPAAGGSTSTTSPASATPPASSTGTAPVPVTFNTLDAIYARLAAAVGSTSLDADQFNFYLNRELPAGKSAPDPVTVWPMLGIDGARGAQMTLSQYWGGMAPYLKANLGLSGLGVFGGLGALMGYR
jgi:hypothetical protein